MKYFEIYQKDTNNIICTGAAEFPKVLIDLKIEKYQEKVDGLQEELIVTQKQYDDCVKADKHWWSRDSWTTRYVDIHLEGVLYDLEKFTTKVNILQNEAVAFEITNKKNSQLVKRNRRIK